MLCNFIENASQTTIIIITEKTPLKNNLGNFASSTKERLISWVFETGKDGESKANKWKRLYTVREQFDMSHSEKKRRDE